MPSPEPPHGPDPQPPHGPDPQPPTGRTPPPAAGGSPDDGSGPPTPSALDLMALGLTMAILVGGGLGLGLLADSQLGTSPWCTFAGLALGVVLAGLAMWQRARSYL